MPIIASCATMDTGADRDAIRSAVSILFQPGEVRELRQLPSARCRIVSGDDLDAATDAAMDLSNQEVYYSLNPIAGDAERASKNTVTRRAWLLIDVDVVRGTKISATDAEKLKAYAVAAWVVNFLEHAGWPEPVLIDSGNGYHVLYRLDLPNSPLSHQIVRLALESIADRFDEGDVKIDRAVHDAPRIAKLPGTMARKGEDTPERPHRLCRIEASPIAIHAVTAEQLQAIAAKPDTKAKGKIIAVDRGSGGLKSYVESAIRRECERVSIAPAGTRNASLNRAAYSLATMNNWPEMNDKEAMASLERVAILAGLSEGETAKTIASGWTSGSQQPRKRPEENAGGQMTRPIPDGVPLIVWASSITPKKVEWLWPRRIPLGKLTTFAGQGGIGKTFVLCDIAARISKGAEWPFCGGECAEQGKVLFISAEDDEDDTLVPRMIQCGADLSQIAFLSAGAAENFNMMALELLTRVLDQMGNVRMVAIDPPTSYLDGIDDHKNSELRSVLTPYKDWCSKRRVAVILNNHVNKSIGKDVDAASRVMGSVAWVNAVRTAHLFMKDENEPEKVVFAPIKTNVGKLPTALTYKIESTGGDEAKVIWDSEENKSADQILSSKGKSRGASAVEWLTGMFMIQREWMSDELRKSATEHGVSKYALFESPEVKALPIDRKKGTNANGEKYWYWRARDGWPSESSESSESYSVSPF